MEEKKIFYIHDPGAMLLHSKYNPDGEHVLTEERCKAAADEAIDSGADVIVSEIYGMVPWYPSEIYPAEEHEKWFRSRFRKEVVSPFASFVKSGGDFVSIMCGETHRKNAEYWLSYRINDYHGLKVPVTDALADARFVSKFYMEHQEERIGGIKDGNSWMDNIMDFQYEDIRVYKLSLIRELIEKYDIDGMMVNFNRATMLFNQQSTTFEQRREIIISFLRTIRGMLDAKSTDTGKEYPFAVELPMDINLYDRLGIDVEAFEQEAGVDTFFVFAGYNTVQSYDTLDYIREKTKKSRVYFQASDTVFYMSNICQNRGVTKEQHYTTAYLAYQHKADGISLFNFAWYRGKGEFGGESYDPPFEILPDLKDPGFLAVQPQHYFKAISRLVFEPMTSKSYDMEFSAPNGGWKADGILRLESHSDEIAGLEMEVKLNGLVLAPTEVVGEPYESPYKNLVEPPSRQLVYMVPCSCLREGKNTVEITNYSDRDISLYYMDLAVR